MQFDTIAAIATPPGSGAINVVRISGKNAFEYANFICSKDINNIPPREMVLVRLYFFNTKKIFDEALVCKMVGPNSFTGEDTVEFFCHGGRMVAKTLLNELIKAGCRMAEAGEFSRRAFLNGKIDLIKAESISNIIEAKTVKALAQAAHQMEGGLSRRIEEIRKQLLLIAAHICAVLDYPEEGISDITCQQAEEQTQKIIKKLDALLETAEQGILIQNGLNTVLVGKPNVGKSSILNALLKEDRAIVTDIPGTTRDILREQANIGGYLINLSDTAGIRKTDDIIEKFGVDRSKESIEKAHLVLLVIDGSSPIDEQDEYLLELTKTKKRLIIVNKTDLPQKIQLPNVDVFISARTGKGLDTLCKKIAEAAADYEQYDDSAILINERQKSLVLRATSNLKSIAFSDLPLDLILCEIEAAIGVLSELTGQNVSEDIIDAVFANFCVGK